AVSVRTLDSAGTPKPGVAVTFTLGARGGSVDSASATSDANGLATPGRWTLGSAGTNTLTATSPSGSTVVFTATATAAAATIVVYDGNNQTVAVGTSVPTAPAARVFDANGINVQGAQVTFTVSSGSCSVTGATVTTDASGVARVGSWTLGSATGQNTLVARIGNGESATFTASGVRQSPDVRVSITQPTTALVGDTVAVIASASSTYELASVVAYLGGWSVTLTSSQAGVWKGTVVITAVPRDTVSLLVGTTVVAGPSASLDQDVNLLAYDGRAVSLVVQARDSRNQTTSVSRKVYVESSTKLQLIAATTGRVMDVMSTRILSAIDSAPASLVIVRDFQT